MEQIVGEWSLQESAFRIDRYAATVRRYRTCIDDGACTAPGPNYPTNIARLESTDHDAYPMGGMSWEQAKDFCAWAGGRLPTAAEWEFAARGHAPDDRRFPWGNTVDCDAGLPGEGCGPTPDCGSYEPHWGYLAPCFRVTDFPATASPFGVEFMMGNGLEWTADWYGTYPPNDAELVDYEGPTTGGMVDVRGIVNAWGPSSDISSRFDVDPDPAHAPLQWAYTSVRCAYD